jgi:predicted nucleic acid-binding protein
VTQFVIIDTDIIIDAARGINQAVHYLQNLKRSTELAISVITKNEVDSWMSSKDKFICFGKISKTLSSAYG